MAISLHQLLSHKTKNIFTSENNNVAKDCSNSKYIDCDKEKTEVCKTSMKQIKHARNPYIPKQIQQVSNSTNPMSGKQSYEIDTVRPNATGDIPANTEVCISIKESRFTVDIFGRWKWHKALRGERTKSELAGKVCRFYPCASLVELLQIVHLRELILRDLIALIGGLG